MVTATNLSFERFLQLQNYIMPFNPRRAKILSPMLQLPRLNRRLLNRIRKGKRQGQFLLTLTPLMMLMQKRPDTIRGEIPQIITRGRAQMPGELVLALQGLVFTRLRGEDDFTDA